MGRGLTPRTRAHSPRLQVARRDRRIVRPDTTEGATLTQPVPDGYPDLVGRTKHPRTWATGQAVGDRVRSIRKSILQLSKHHGLGNDFLVALDERNSSALRIDPDLVRRLCDRHRGLGADGLLHGSLAPDGSAQAQADIVMELFNADGSRAEMSGNGVRCFAQAVAMARGIGDGALRIATDAGTRELVLAPGSRPNELLVTVQMGAAVPGPELGDDVDGRAGGRCATASIGNPHLVVLLAEGPLPTGDELAARGSALESLFGGGINVEFARAIEADRIEVTVWERGAGITEACGTGACATTWVLNRWGVASPRATVTMPGGAVDVLVSPDDHVTLIGPTEYIADIEVP